MPKIKFHLSQNTMCSSPVKRQRINEINILVLLADLLPLTDFTSLILDKLCLRELVSLVNCMLPSRTCKRLTHIIEQYLFYDKTNGNPFYEMRKHNNHFFASIQRAFIRIPSIGFALKNLVKLIGIKNHYANNFFSAGLAVRRAWQGLSLPENPFYFYAFRGAPNLYIHTNSFRDGYDANTELLRIDNALEPSKACIFSYILLQTFFLATRWKTVYKHTGTYVCLTPDAVNSKEKYGYLPISTTAYQNPAVVVMPHCERHKYAPQSISRCFPRNCHEHSNISTISRLVFFPKSLSQAAICFTTESCYFFFGIDKIEIHGTKSSTWISDMACITKNGNITYYALIKDVVMTNFCANRLSFEKVPFVILLTIIFLVVGRCKFKLNFFQFVSLIALGAGHVSRFSRKREKLLELIYRVTTMQIVLYLYIIPCSFIYTLSQHKGVMVWGGMDCYTVSPC